MTSKRKAECRRNGSLFFTIFLSGPPKEGKPSPYFGEYPPDFSDFIVIDECHRGGSNDESTWRDILNSFAPAVQLGLTAAPNAKTTSTLINISASPSTSTHSKTASTTAS